MIVCRHPQTNILSSVPSVQKKSYGESSATTTRRVLHKISRNSRKLSLPSDKIAKMGPINIHSSKSLKRAIMKQLFHWTKIIPSTCWSPDWQWRFPKRCTALHYAIYNSYLKPFYLFVNEKKYMTKKNTKQDNSFAMAMYSIPVLPLIEGVKNERKLQQWYPNDGPVAVTSEDLLHILDKVVKQRKRVLRRCETVRLTPHCQLNIRLWRENNLPRDCKRFRRWTESL